MAAFLRITNGTTELMLVAGYSGVGKSVLVNEVHKPITAKRGNFITGKYDQYQKNIPYYAISQGFNYLCNQLLTESESVLKQWQEQILAAVGNNGQVLIDVIPNLKLVIGEQPPVAQVAGQEAQNRFNLVFQNFIKAICQAEHPLVFFVDDLQWADSASLKLLKIILGDRNIQNLLIVGAYRDNEVDSIHPLMMTLDEIKKEGGFVSKIHLQNLTPKDVNALIAEALGCSTIFSQPLTNLVYETTQGNAFFITEFLKSLYTDMLLSFDYPKKQWCWDLEQIQAKDITDNVVELMTIKIVNLAEVTQKNLQLAACIGNNFDLSTLAVISQQSAKQVLDHLLPALQESLIAPTNNQYYLRNFRDEKKASYKFQHDRVQQAAYYLIPEAQKKATHLKIGRLILSNTSAAEQEEKIFEIVNQLNIGAELIDTENEQNELVKLNLLAGAKAKASAAYEAALGYFLIGSKLLAVDCWQTNYDLTLTLFESAAEAALLCSDFTQMNRWVEEVLQHAKTLLNKVKVYEIKITALTLEGELQAATTTGLEVLQALEINFPSPLSPLELGKALQQTADHLAGREVKYLINLPQMQSDQQLAAMQIISSIVSPAFREGHEVLPFLVLKMVNLSLEHGNTALSTIGYVMYGLILCGVLVEIPLGYQFGQLALSLLELYDAQYLECHINFVFNVCICHWQEPVQKTIKPLKEAYQIGRDQGDIEFSRLCVVYDSVHSLVCAENLVEVERQIASYHYSFRQGQNKMALEYLAIYWQLTLNLLGAENTCLLSGAAYREEQMLLWHQQANDRTGLALLYCSKLILCYLFQDFLQAAANAQELEKCLNAVTGTIIVPLDNFYDSLTALAIYADALPSAQKGLLEKVTANQAKMQNWANYAPTNLLHKFYLVEAERHRVLGQKAEAIEMYDRAIAKATEHEYLNEQAIANELAAKFYLQWGKDRIAQDYLLNAHYAYTRWGAKAKVEDLEKRYPQFFIQTARNSQFPTSQTISTNTTRSTFLDLKSILKASQILGREIKLDTLLTKLMTIVIENAGLIVVKYIREELKNQIVRVILRTGQPGDAPEESVILNYDINDYKLKVELTRQKLITSVIAALRSYRDLITIEKQTAQLTQALHDLQQTQYSLVQKEKMSALGNLVTAIAHKINNPINFIAGNLKPAQEYIHDLFGLIDLYRQTFPEPGAEIEKAIATIDLDYLQEDLPKLICSLKEGSDRIRGISASLRTFSRGDSDRKVLFNIHEGIESTLLILKHRLKANEHHPVIELVKDYGQIPQLECFPGQLNQVFMNLIANAIDALEESNKGRSFQQIQNNPNRITIQTTLSEDQRHVLIRIQDNGEGMSENVKQKLFSYLFTTKAVGKGTGLGLSISRQIVQEKHGGQLTVTSELGKGTELAIVIPVGSGEWGVRS
ncbi:MULTISPECIES: trifunctional serine/threonine-protein kinase/ATP-binding protein/sensor histidine kinase [unclassified Nostoc]|uniref:trifunctional serine/threonine-protein kinase/ATP-binding protein/sensor histidine kinase n=1 Tax=unclassified Nostoc TaxID=2593658 RepID=UPI0026107078|nr:AAA family ATPase [Nostoc sp. S13]MDF5739781.1 AAA family ATPase [Nostoc sp. S13]